MCTSAHSLPTKSNTKERFPSIWQSNGTIQKIPESNIKYVEGYHVTDKCPDHYILDYPIENFRIYVNSNDYFMSKLTVINITDFNKAAWDNNESYYHVCFSMYCSSYCCSISIQHLKFNADVFPIITSLMRFHVYFTIRRLLRRMKGSKQMSAISREFSAGNFYRHIEHIRRNMIYRTRGGVVYQLFPNTLHSDYKRYVPIVSNGFTKIGIQYLNESIEAFLYSILGAQARTKQSVISNRASAIETQQEFRDIVNDSIINYNVSTWINNMNRSITDTNLVRNLAISPSLWLIPSTLIILKNPIKGYNNKLRIATTNMKFCINADIIVHTQCYILSYTLYHLYIICNSRFWSYCSIFCSLGYLC